MGFGRVRVWMDDELIVDDHNTVVTLGRNYLADNWRARTNVIGLTTAAGYCAVGYGSGATTAGMSGLQSEAPTGSVGRTLIGSVAREVTGSTITWTTHFYNSGGLGPLTECGLFGTGYAIDEATLETASATTDSGILYARKTFGVQTKTTAVAMTVEWTYTI